MQRFVITFPMYHPLSSHWIEVEAENDAEASQIAFRLFGRRYGSTYQFDDFAAYGRCHYPIVGQIGKVIRLSDIPPQIEEETE